MGRMVRKDLSEELRLWEWRWASQAKSLGGKASWAEETAKCNLIEAVSMRWHINKTKQKQTNKKKTEAHNGWETCLR